MSQEDGLSNGEFEISVAAAAFAIVSLEERDGAKTKGEKEEKRIRTTNLGTNSGSFFWWFSKDEAKDADKLAGDKSTTKSQTTTQHDSTVDLKKPTVDLKKPEMIMNNTPSIRRTATLSDKSTGIIKSSQRDGSRNETTQGAKSHSVKKKTRFASFKKTASKSFGSPKDK
uniref:Uncharacterized protein n=1 Tax=Ananas comosus var. bracteatus TaxID=296719 RepID=A0A6V7NLH9_ANACO|nr:unnamed protein product [Ananas comosus var. bracteatus]